MFQKKIEEQNILDKQYKNKLLSIFKEFKQNNLSSVIMSDSDSTKKSENFKLKRTSIKNLKDNEDTINKENSVNIKFNPLTKFPKMLNGLLDGIKLVRKKTPQEQSVNSNIQEIFNDNDVWAKTENKNGKIIENDTVVCLGNCHLCKLVRIILNDLLKREIKFNIYEKYMMDNYVETYIFNKNLKYNFHISNYLMKQEGTNRIRNKFHLKVDKILNGEIQDKNKNREKNMIKEIFKFYKKTKISKNLIDFFNLGQVFEIDFISDIIDQGDTYQCSCNCLLFQGFNYINSVLILGEKKIYIMTNMLLDSELILYNSDCPIKKSFWVEDNYLDILNEHCKYLQAYDLYSNEDNEGNMIKKKEQNQKQEQECLNSNQINGFNFISFSYCRINELHKRRFLHQNNSIEIFLKNGLNYYLAFNKEVRDMIVNKIIQNISNSINLINDLFISNTSFNHLNEITNYNSQSIKNDNMIFMTDTELFKEREQKILTNKKKQTNLNKIKNNCKIIDIKDILEQATEHWSNGYIDTYSYIMILNTLSGRTYNDLDQYPVYPWILQDYSSDIIDLKNVDSYRDFNYPIYAQDKE